MAEAAVAERTATAEPKSFLNSPEFGADIQKALDTDSHARANVEQPAAPVPPVTHKTEKAEKTNTITPVDDMPPEIKSEEGKRSWKAWKQSAEEKERSITKERDEWKSKHDTVNSRIAELEKAAKTPAQQAKLEDLPEYQQLKALADARAKEVEDYSERIRLIDVEQHPMFQAYFKKKTDAQFEIAKEIGGDKLVDALKLPPGEYRKQQLNEIAAELDTIGQSQLGSVLTRLREIESERASEVASAKNNYQQIQAQQKEQTEKQRAQIEGAFQAVAQEVTDKENGLSVFQERDGDAEWNKGVQDRLALAQATFTGKLKPENAARQAHWAAAAPVLLTELNTVLKQKADLEKQITELRALAPNPGGAKAGDDTTTTTSTTRGLDAMMEKIVEVLPSVRS